MKDVQISGKLHRIALRLSAVNFLQFPSDCNRYDWRHFAHPPQIGVEYKERRVKSQEYWLFGESELL